MPINENYPSEEQIKKARAFMHSIANTILLKVYDVFDEPEVRNQVDDYIVSLGVDKSTEGTTVTKYEHLLDEAYDEMMKVIHKETA